MGWCRGRAGRYASAGAEAVAGGTFSVLFSFSPATLIPSVARIVLRIKLVKLSHILKCRHNHPRPRTRVLFQRPGAGDDRVQCDYEFVFHPTSPSSGTHFLSFSPYTLLRSIAFHKLKKSSANSTLYAGRDCGGGTKMQLVAHCECGPAKPYASLDQGPAVLVGVYGERDVGVAVTVEEGPGGERCGVRGGE